MTEKTIDLTSRGYRTEVRREEDGSWSLTIPSLPGLAAVGDTFDEAWADLPDVIDLWIETAEARGLPVPNPDQVDPEDTYSGRFALRMPRSLHGALARCAEMEGTSINSFCVTALTSAVAYGAIHEPVTVGRRYGGATFQPKFVAGNFRDPAAFVPATRAANVFLLGSTLTKLSDAH